MATRVGAFTSPWEQFKEWKRVASEAETPDPALETALRGVCEPARLLDLVENFTLFSDQSSQTVKVLAQSHQYLGVTRALAAVTDARAGHVRGRRRLGVFWHTQGSGKSLSMVFFTRKILRKLPGNWTFVVVTDREELDDQIYKTFTGVGAVGKEAQVQARSGQHLQQLLRSDHRYVFTLIQKFRSDSKGAAYPVLSERGDIIVLADEAHRSQYDVFAQNLGLALPNAGFIGFTGTPLMAGEEKTREVFGDYVSIYNYRQAIEDEATVPLYYEPRIPELHLTGDDLERELADALDEADLDESTRARVEQRFAHAYTLVTREDRLDQVAADVVRHFAGRPRRTKAMFVAIDKVTAVRMYDRVKAAWAAHLAARRGAGADASELEYLAATDMAVVLSSAQNEVEEFARRGLEILPHRQRMQKEDLATRFKADDDPLRLVFVCAMWMTGFDAPSCGVVYLDKPMRNHTLMQTIARANRVYEGKENGLIVDYVGVFRNLQRALEIYGPAAGGGIREGDRPVQPKSVQIEELRATLAEAEALCREHGIDPDALAPQRGLQRVRNVRAAADRLVHPPGRRHRFLHLAARTDRLWRAIGLDDRRTPLGPMWGVITDLGGGIRSLDEPVDISELTLRLEKLLDASITASAPTPQPGAPVALGHLDFDALARALQQTPHKASAAEILTVAARVRVEAMVQRNPTRRPLRQSFAQIVDDYNEGAQNVDEFFVELLEFMKRLDDELARARAHHLSEAQLAVDDILMAHAQQLTPEDRERVRHIARTLESQLAPVLVLDWRKFQTTRAAVRKTIEAYLDDHLPDAYTKDLFEIVAGQLYEHVFEAAHGRDRPA
jgi:type I restriction enzyme, R subunit